MAKAKDMVAVIMMFVAIMMAMILVIRVVMANCHVLYDSHGAGHHADGIFLGMDIIKLMLQACKKASRWSFKAVEVNAIVIKKSS